MVLGKELPLWVHTEASRDTEANDGIVQNRVYSEHGNWSWQSRGREQKREREREWIKGRKTGHEHMKSEDGGVRKEQEQEGRGVSKREREKESKRWGLASKPFYSELGIACLCQITVVQSMNKMPTFPYFGLIKKEKLGKGDGQVGIWSLCTCPTSCWLWCKVSLGKLRKWVWECWSSLSRLVWFLDVQGV